MTSLPAVILIDVLGAVAALRGQATLLGMQPISRDVARTLGNETRRILAAGHYRSPSGQRVYIRDDLRAAVDGTIEYRPGDDLDVSQIQRRGRTRVSVVNSDALSVARQHAERRPLVLNFASATHPGGGWLSGARAQEESIARSSGLVPCLEGRDIYTHNRQQQDAVYSDHVIWSPGVPVFREHHGALMEAPFACGMLTAAAVNRRRLEARRFAEADAAMAERIDRVIHVAAVHGHPVLVLGAWGCGAFRNDPAVVAQQFKQALRSLDGAFEDVIFAVVDWSDSRKFIGPFASCFR